MPFRHTPLFGGAITADLPTTFTDASNIRQIPDHQEVFLDAQAYTSIVVEILEYVDEGKSDEEALGVHVADLVGDDGVRVLEGEGGRMEEMPNYPLLLHSLLQTPPSPPPNPTPLSSSAPRSSSRKTPDFTAIYLLLLRLKPQKTDILVSVNVPHYPGEYVAAPQQATGEKTALMKEGEEIRERIRESLEVRDWGLFEA